MKQLQLLSIAISVLCMNSALKSQDTANYKGDLVITESQTLPITLQIITCKDTVLLYMGSPLQTKEMIPASKTKFTPDSVKFNISDMAIKVRLKYFDGKRTLKGSFRQGLLSKQIMFERTENLFTYNRPQTPVAPFAYQEKELSFTNPECAYTFHGTLTYPNKEHKYPVVVLVSGSGCQNRDEEIFLHKPFMVIADYLSKNGIAVFRFDDRGYGSRYTDMNKGTTLDFAMDVRCAVNMLKNEDCIDTNNIFILGHSEGGMICEILGSQSKDLKGLILMAAPAISGKDILLSQTEAVMRLNGEEESKIKNALSEIENAQYDINTVNGLWLDYFYHFNPAEYLKKLTVPLLVLQGGKDMQVIADVNLKEMRKHLPKSSSQNREKLYPNLNHLFQNCKTGNPDEYAQIEETISEEVLSDIKEFILKTAK